MNGLTRIKNTTYTILIVFSSVLFSASAGQPDEESSVEKAPIDVARMRMEIEKCEKIGEKFNALASQSKNTSNGNKSLLFQSGSSGRFLLMNEEIRSLLRYYYPLIDEFRNPIMNPILPNGYDSLPDDSSERIIMETRDIQEQIGQLCQKGKLYDANGQRRINVGFEVPPTQSSFLEPWTIPSGLFDESNHKDLIHLLGIVNDENSGAAYSPDF